MSIKSYRLHVDLKLISLISCIPYDTRYQELKCSNHIIWIILVINCVTCIIRIAYNSHSIKENIKVELALHDQIISYIIIQWEVIR